MNLNGNNEFSVKKSLVKNYKAFISRDIIIFVMLITHDKLTLLGIKTHKKPLRHMYAVDLDMS